MDDVLLDTEALAQLDVAVHEVDRGGEVTYHGPGQLVGYPIIDIRTLGGPVRYVRALEAALMEALAAFGVAGHRQLGMPGVWVGDPPEERKIAAIGLRVSRGVSSHGFALNVSTDLEYFQAHRGVWRTGPSGDLAGVRARLCGGHRSRTNRSV